jgi:hypothetical protein
MTEDYRAPVLFLIFNRPECTNETFTAISKAKPKKLYIAADGPRIEKQGEKELCEQTREVINRIDWDCDVKTLFRENNLGCKDAVSGAITWFFENEEMGIILEDDCLPANTFFQFCEELLVRYKDDTRIWHIDGSTFQKLNTEASYDFSKYCLIWGWATWRRAWNKYAVEFQNFKEFKDKNVMQSIWEKPSVIKYWLNRFDLTDKSVINTWDYQWMYTVWINNGMTIRPSVSLIKNIGFGPDATHTHTSTKVFDEMKNRDMRFPLKHPLFFVPNKKLDDECSAERFEIYSTVKNIVIKVVNKIKAVSGK